METRTLLSDTEDDQETISVDQESLSNKLAKTVRLQQSISIDLFSHHETTSRKHFRHFMYITFLAIAILTTLASQILPNFVKFGRNDKEKKNMDISSWVLTGISVLAFIIYWPFSKAPESKKISSLNKDRKEEIEELSLMLAKIHADCDIQFSDKKELYSSTAVMLNNLMDDLNDEKKSSIKKIYKRLSQVDSIVETINALDQLQNKPNSTIEFTNEDDNLSLRAGSSSPHMLRA